MARRRRNQSASIRLAPALKAVALCLVIGGAGLGYVWHKSEIARLNVERRDLLIRKAQAEKDIKQLSGELDRLCSPASLESKNERWGLGMVPPPPSQVWRLAEPAELPQAVPVGDTSGARLIAENRYGAGHP